MKKIKSRKFKEKKIRELRLFLWVLLGGVIFYCTSYVSAGEYDSVIEKNRVDNVYAIATIDGRTRIFYLNMYELNDRTSYCIDLGVDITTDIYHSTNDFKASYLSDEQIEYIRAISYFGYGYEGHNDYKYYMAAQEIIWEYLEGLEVEWTNEMKVDGVRINIDSYKEEILMLKKLYDKKIDLEWNSGQAYKVNSEIVIKDNNNILSDYEVVSAKYSDVSIENDSIVIKAGNVIGEERIELKRKGFYNYDSLLYYYDKSQRLISNGNYKDVDEVIEFNIEGVNLRAKMMNKNGTYYPLGEGSFEGSIYELYDSNNNLIGTYETDSKGTFMVNGLVYGDYYFKHKVPSEGYLLNEDNRYFSIDNGDKEMHLKQYPISASIEIKKVYGSNGDYKPEKNVLFYIYNNTGYKMINAFTNGSGKIMVTLYYGTYRIHQVTTTTGYAKVDDFIIDVKEHSDDTIYYNLVDDKIFIKVRVNTVDSVSGDKIKREGLAYKLRNKNENTYLEYDGIDIFKTDSNGDLLIPILLEYGDYVLEQVDVPKGILLNKEDFEFSVNDNSKLDLVDDNLIMNVNFTNELVMGEVKVVALEEKFYKDINNYGYEDVYRIGSEFSLISNEDIIVNGNVKYKKGEVIYNGITDDKGEIVINNLFLGSYCLIDKDTKEEKCFILDSNDKEIKVVKEKYEFYKELMKGDIIINNLSNEGEIIVGSIFELIDNEDMVIYSGITNDEGVIKIEDIILGDYCIRQKEVSSNYLKLDNDICFSLEGDKELEIVNEKQVNKIISIPDTLRNSIGFYEAMVMLVMIGTGYIVYKKIFNSKLYR